MGSLSAEPLGKPIYIYFNLIIYIIFQLHNILEAKQILSPFSEEETENTEWELT